MFSGLAGLDAPNNNRPDNNKRMTAPIPVETSNVSHALAGKYLTFLLGEESYGIAVLAIREIIRMTDITSVPQMPDHVKGVINLRGKIIPILDLRLKFRLPCIETTERTCIVVVQTSTTGSWAKAPIGLIVTAVEEVLNVSASDIDEAPDFGSKVEMDHILGLVKVKGRVKTLLDIDQVLRPDSVLVPAQSMGAE